MNPKNFLTIGGLVLVVVGILGMIGVIGPTANQSIFHSAWWFDSAENWAHLILGVVGLIAAFAFPDSVQRPLVMVLGVVGIVVAVYNIFSTSLGSAHLENPLDLILHAVVGIWALLSSKKSGAASVMPGM